MSKTQEWLKIFAIQGVVLCIMEENNLEMSQAMDKFYNSECFDKLEDIETGLYTQSCAYIYDLYKENVANIKR
jgi:hypothetical protein